MMIAGLIYGSFFVALPLVLAVSVLTRAEADRRCAHACRLYWEIQRSEQHVRDLEARVRRLEKVQRKARLARNQLLLSGWKEAA